MRQKTYSAYYIGLRAVLIGCAILCLLGISFPAGTDKIPKVLNGIDVLRQQNFKPLAGKRVGLITNHTGLAADGTSTIDLFRRSKICKLVALFSPEHGPRGLLDDRVVSSVDEVTGLPVYSLYGGPKKPTPEMLNRIEALVFDIQDIGTRFYSYNITMAYCMEAAAEANIQFYVLDRPNPVGGIQVEGPMLDEDKTSFVGYMPMPIRHGMTSGELARFFNRENEIGADLHVIEMEGWRRTFYYEDTGQLWVNPSPNMRNMLEAILYPGVALLEKTNVSVGRGTDRPFEVVGAPWIEPRRFAAALREAQPAGIEFVPLYFTPEESKNKGEMCGGVHIMIVDREKVHSVMLGLTLISVLHRLYPDEFELDNVMQLLCNAKAMEMLKAGLPPVEVLQAAGPEVDAFMSGRRKALIYGPIQ
jgi:uncharacterized protein YbbC (DUF1343 family)